MIQRYFPYYLRLLKLATPLVLTQAGQVSVQLIDNAMIGHYGTAELAAASFANTIHIVVMLFGIGVFMGITPLIGHARGSKNDSLAAVVLKSGFALSALLIPAVTLVSWSIVWTMPFMGQTDEVVRLAARHESCIVLGNAPHAMVTLEEEV